MTLPAFIQEMGKEQTTLLHVFLNMLNLSWHFKLVWEHSLVLDKASKLSKWQEEVKSYRSFLKRFQHIWYSTSCAFHSVKRALCLYAFPKKQINILNELSSLEKLLWPQFKKSFLCLYLVTKVFSGTDYEVGKAFLSNFNHRAEKVTS